jgi:hypothetical protein
LHNREEKPDKLKFKSNLLNPNSEEVEWPYSMLNSNTSEAATAIPTGHGAITIIGGTLITHIPHSTQDIPIPYTPHHTTITLPHTSIPIPMFHPAGTPCGFDHLMNLHLFLSIL